MKKIWWFFIPIIVVLFGCFPSSDTVNETPTPFPTNEAVPTTAVSLANQQGRPTTLSEIAAAPEQFENLQLRVTGQFRRFPTLLCGRATMYESPVSWGLVSDGFLAQGSGFDEQLRRLVEENLTLTVEGVWRRWRGPVGCGKRARTQELWYLDINQIVSPSPLVRVTLTPTLEVEGGTAVAAAPTAEGTMPPIAVDATATPDLSPPTATTDALLQPTATPTLTPSSTMPATSPTASAGGDGTNTPESGGSGTGTPSSGSGSPTAAATQDATSQPQPTADATAAPGSTSTPSSNATATASLATATPGGGDMVEQSELFPYEVGGALLAVGETHRWTYDGLEGEELSIYAIGLEGQNISMALLGPSGNALSQRNSEGVDEAEAILSYTLLRDGIFTIEISSANNVASYYHLVIADGGEIENIVFNGALMDGDAPTTSLAQDEDDFWHFVAEAGDLLSLVIDPAPSADASLGIDPIYYLYAPDGSLVEIDTNTAQDGYTDMAGFDENEVLTDYTLPATGLYALRIGEFDFNEMEYTLTFELN